MTEIRVSYNTRDIDEIMFGTIVHARFLGVKGRARVVFAFVLPMLLGMIAVHYFTALDMLSKEVLAMIWLLYASIACWCTAIAYNAKKMRQINDLAWYRQMDITWVLDAHGCTQNDGPLWPWSGMTNLYHTKNATVLDFALRRMVVIPDIALPLGTTPATLKEQITAWSSK